MAKTTTLKERKEKLIHDIKAKIIATEKQPNEKKALLAIVDSFRGSYLELERLHESLDLS